MDSSASEQGSKLREREAKRHFTEGKKRVGRGTRGTYRKRLMLATGCGAMAGATGALTASDARNVGKSHKRRHFKKSSSRSQIRKLGDGQVTGGGAKNTIG